MEFSEKKMNMLKIYSSHFFLNKSLDIYLRREKSCSCSLFHVHSKEEKNFSVAIDREPNATKILRKIKRKKKS